MVQVYEKAPDFTAPTAAGKGEIGEVTLSRLRGRWVVLFFYPLDFTSVCPTEILEFSKRAREFEALGAQVLGCSVDSVHSHKAWIEHGLGELAIPLVSDITKRIARDYGALLEDRGIATRATYLVDPEGVVQYACFHNTAVGRSVSETLRVLEALQTGEKCPVDWRPGAQHARDADPGHGSSRRGPGGSAGARRPPCSYLPASSDAAGTPSALAIFSMVSSGGERWPRSSMDT